MGYFFQPVDVDERAAGHFAHRRVHIAGHGDIDQKNRAAVALRHQALHIVASNDEVRAAGGADDNVGVAHGLPNLAELNRQAAQLLRQGDGLRVGAIAHQHRRDAFGNQVARRQFAHLPGADNHYRLVLQAAKGLLRQLDGGGAYGDRRFRHVGFRPHALGGVEHAMENRLQRVAARLRFLRQKIRLA